MTQSGSTYWDRQMVSLGRAVHTIREGADVDGLIAAAIAYLQESFEYRLIWISLFDAENHALIGKGGVTPSGEIKFLRERFTLQPGDLLDTVVIQRKPLPIADLRKEIRSGEWMKIAQRFDVQGTIIFPIYYRKTSIGLAILGSHHWNVSPRADEKARLSVVFGTLAASLNRLELDKQQQKRIDAPLMHCLDRMREHSTLIERLEEIVEEIQRFLLPTRTYLYQYDRDQRVFSRRASNRLKAPGKRGESNHTIAVQSSPAFYQTLSSDQMIVMADTKITRSDLNLINLRIFNNPGLGALMVAPILVNGELDSFLLVENDQARLWTEEEKRFLRGVAQLIELITPLESMEITLRQSADDQLLTAGIAQAIYSEADVQEALQVSAEKLCERLKVERLWLAAFNEATGIFEIRYQFHPRGLRPLPTNLGELSLVDSQLLEQSREAIAVENLDYDLKFLSWRSTLTSMGVKSILLSSTTRRKSKLEGILVVGHEAPRSWSRPEKEIARAVAQQLGLIIHQGELQRGCDDREQLQQTIYRGLATLQRCHSLENLHTTAVQLAAQIMQAPLAVLLTWLPGRPGGHIAGIFASQDAFKLNITETMLAIDVDPLVQWSLQTEGMMTLSVHDLPESTRQWLNAPGIGQLVSLALRTAPGHLPTGLILVADRMARTWEDSTTQGLTILVNQLAWARRHHLFAENIGYQKQELERLNWYKHRRLEDIHRSVSASMQRLSEKETQENEAGGGVRIQQVLKSLQSAIASLPQTFNREQWRLRSHGETAPLSGLLKRGLERIETLLHQKKMWSQVHNQTNVMVSGDVAKIEMVLHELLLFACGRSENGSRIDLWCRQVDDRSVEVALTDHGEIDPNLLLELQEGRNSDLLAPSLLDQSPGLHLSICQALMREAGGEVSLYQLEDHRILSRLVLPISPQLGE